MIDYIRSKSIKEYLEQEGTELTDLYKAALILRADYPMEMIHESLEELVESTEDEELKKAVRKKMEEQRLEVASIKKKQDGTVYTLEVYEPDEEKYINEGYYNSFKAAEKHARCFCMEHIIRKYRLFGEEDMENHFHAVYGYIMSELGALLLNSVGKVSKCLSDICRTGSEDGILDNCCLILKHPFHKGDIVKNLITGQTGIINDCECTIDEWMEQKRRTVVEENNRNTGILVEYADPVGNFFQLHTFPYDLEYAEESAAGCECDARWEVLKAAQRLLQGKGTLERFTDCKARLEAKKRYW